VICAADRADADLYDGRALDYGYAFAEAVSAPVVVEFTGFSAAFGAEECACVGCGWGHCFIIRGFEGVWIRGCMAGMLFGPTEDRNMESPFYASTLPISSSSTSIRFTKS